MIRLLLLLAVIICLPSTARAEETIDLNEWSSLPILHQGRVKPLDSFAHIYLKTFSDRRHPSNMSAEEWLAETLFTPGLAIERPLFKIRQYARYDLPENEGKLYSYLDLSRVIQNKNDIIQKLIKQDEKNWSADQKELMDLYQNFILYTQMLRSFTLFLPLSDNDPAKETNFLNYKDRIEDLHKQAQKIVQRKGTDLEKYTSKEKEVALLSYQLQIMAHGGQNNVLFKVIPAENGEKWLSPWELAQINETNTNTEEQLAQWQKLTHAYLNHDQAQWDNTVQNLKSEAHTTKLKTEQVYNNLHLKKIAVILYAFCLSLLVFANLFRKETFIKYAYGSLIIGALCHAVHIGLRVYILDRPPVGTLYESILFVSLICALSGIFLEYKQKNTIGLLLGSLSGLILLTTATAFAGEDTMNTLVAVLNTNFWLATHVLCITIGYGWCLVVAILAHLYLLRRITQPENKDLLTLLRRNIKTLSILALLFTAIGTILGGIWADQSWGRFWGWDPKENGALLIVLWLIWILHSRISNHLDDLGFAAGAAFLSVIVILAWFGVNLLSVGLHSYGFISGIAWGIGLFCVAEILCIGSLWFFAIKKRKVSQA